MKLEKALVNVKKKPTAWKFYKTVQIKYFGNVFILYDSSLCLVHTHSYI